MRDPIVLPTLTHDGQRAFMDLLRRTKHVESPSERVPLVAEILGNPDFAVPHPSGILIDRAARMETAMQVGDELYPKLAPLGVSGLVDPGINAGLNATYVDQFVGPKAKHPQSYVLARHGDSAVRNYRNGLYVYMRFYMEHEANPGGTATMLLENCLAYQITNPMEKLAQQPGIMAAPAALDLVGLAMLNENGKFVRPSKKETGGVAVVTETALQELSVVFTQSNKNWDIPGMTSAAQLIPMIPDTPGLIFYKRRAKKALAERSRATKTPSVG